MWEDFSDRFDTNSIKSTFQNLRPWYYVLALVPLFVGAFLGADGTDFRFAPLLFLVLTVAAGRVCFSLWYGSRDESGQIHAVDSDYFFVPSRFVGDSVAARGILFLAAIVTVVCGIILCLISGWGLLAFGVLALLCYAAVGMGYDTKIPGARQVLVLFSEGFLLAGASFYSQCGYFAMSSFTVSLPIGLMLAALVIAEENENRRRYQARGFSTLGQRFDRDGASRVTLAFIIAAYIFILLNVLYGVTNLWPVLLLLLIPLLYKSGWRRKHEVGSFYIKFGFLYALALLLQFAF